MKGFPFFFTVCLCPNVMLDIRYRYCDNLFCSEEKTVKLLLDATRIISCTLYFVKY